LAFTAIAKAPTIHCYQKGIAMRKLAVLILIAVTALPGFAAKRFTVQQLEQLVATIHDKPDADLAGRLSEFELSNRLSAARMARIKEQLQGPMARDALVVLFDASAFLPLPAEDLTATAAPDATAQRQILDAATQYAMQALSKLPNFYATRETALFMDAPARPGRMTVPADQTLQFEQRSSATVLYREGKQVVETEAAAGRKSNAGLSGLVTSGEFGPILGTLLADAQKGQLAWSYWEQGARGQ
jgi:hypothetical protein